MDATNPTTSSLSVLLDYYSGQKELLSEGAYQTLETTGRVAAYQKHSTISEPDFLNYLLIHRDNIGAFATYRDRLERVATARTWLDEVITLNGTVNVVPGFDDLQERVGEAVSLSVASQLFGLTQADWMRIPEQKGAGARKTFDFEKALVGITESNAVIQIEAKGTFVNDNRIGQPNVYSHANNIREKKLNIKAAGDDYQHPATAFYGMIVSVDHVNPAKCWLLDPPPLPFEGNPRNVKIATRLEYIAALSEMLAPQAKLPIALRESANNWRVGKGNKNVLAGFPYTTANYVEHFLAKNKLWLAEQDVVGEVFVGETGNAFFLGIDGELIREAIRQDGDRIVNLRYSPTVEIVTVFEEPRNIQSWTKGERQQFRLQLFKSSSGVVIGLPQEKK
jgi:hypothetical protein